MNKTAKKTKSEQEETIYIESAPLPNSLPRLPESIHTNLAASYKKGQ